MKDAVLSIRLPSRTRAAVERFAEREGRSLSQAAERLIEMGLAASLAGAVAEPAVPYAPAAPPPLAGSLTGGLVPTLEDFRDVRAALSASMGGRARLDARARR